MNCNVDIPGIIKCPLPTLDEVIYRCLSGNIKVSIHRENSHFLESAATWESVVLCWLPENKKVTMEITSKSENLLK